MDVLPVQTDSREIIDKHARPLQCSVCTPHITTCINEFTFNFSYLLVKLSVLINVVCALGYFTFIVSLGSYVVYTHNVAYMRFVIVNLAKIFCTNTCGKHGMSCERPPRAAHRRKQGIYYLLQVKRISFFFFFLYSLGL